MLRNGLINWTGESQIDGKQIVLLTSGFKSVTNRKTGFQLQTWILRADVSPVEAVRTGEDYSICAYCSRRGIAGKGRTCYVLPFQAPTRVYKQFIDKNYIDFKPEHLSLYRNRSLRLGSYGDPAAIPYLIWEPLIAAATWHTGFTRQWMLPIAEKLKGICQASCNTIEEAEQASKMGWKVYLSLPLGSSKPRLQESKLLECPYQKTNGLVQCNACNLCDGSRANVWVYDHGAKYKQRKENKEEQKN